MAEGRHGKQLIILPGQQQQQQQYVQQPTHFAHGYHVHPAQQAHMHQRPMAGYGQQVMQPQPMMMQPQVPNYGVGMQFNTWARPNFNYTSMPGYQQVNYSGGWNPNVHDQMLKTHINRVFMQYDQNRNGQLEQH